MTKKAQEKTELEKDERPNREKDKIPISPYRQIPKGDRVLCRIMNIEMPGQRIEACLNGVNWSCADGEDVELHTSQIEALQHTLIETSEFIPNEAGSGYTIKPVRIPRVAIQIMGVAIAPVVESPPGAADPEKTADSVQSGRG